MKILMIDCSNGMEIEVLNEGKRASYIDRDEKKHTDSLLLVVDEQLQKVGLKIGDIEYICVCVGPGSFTGIRVAISICKGLAVNGNVKICTASNFDVIENAKYEKAYYVLDGFSDNVYVRKVNKEKASDRCMRVAELVSEIEKDEGYEVYCVTEKTQKLLKKYEISTKKLKIDVVSCFLNKIKDKKFTPINEISPVYLRASQAEIERELKIKNEKK